MTDPRDAEILADRLAGAIREAMRNGHVGFRVEDVPGGLTDIDGTFNLSNVARACLAEIERAGFKLVPA